ncbi:MAG: bifunctional demethylmenaquinone methyltransferase/2-methoxy-6-polyprenyl-1,4-benzoquinol methylase UbiE [Acidobacteria bacterium]|nr:bifunctional demethylmenaquinone methyltransferase/2-methoxy-6-polyprenyl-1,4-benzoquinol methylase UbiE [Acidobacteriota bacterium]MCL5288262.1 bifunctional demethylmenaquinone methyltransferase/2-methoxy-6-polyprenyl-1,4-benzoquinol methylase UbiE [Acidobacteriota bacterium]
MFSRIAPRYDFLNHLLSFSLDRIWRRRTARKFGHILARPGARALDLCCGTGDLTLALWKEAKREGKVGARVVGSDFAHPMLTLARKKFAVEGPQEYVEADALNLPFTNASFDLVTAAFGFRNLANYEAGLREIFRVLRPGGKVGILEFTDPKSSFVGSIYRFYLQRIVPHVGGVISGSHAAYSYLPVSVSKFPSAEELTGLMTKCGFADSRFELWTMRTVALHTGRRE